MKKKLGSLPLAFILAALIGALFYTSKPQSVRNETAPLNEFSARRALKTVARMSEKPHFVGSAAHDQVAGYLTSELRNLGLQPEVQEGYTLTEWGNLVKSRNILVRVKGTGNGKALLLLSHYDSAPHSKSHGAADDGSGVATVLEGLRAFLHAKTAHQNDLVVLFTDAEELGLNGAALFVQKHPWASQVGAAINFEARGTGGPSYMLMEINQGNAKMVEHFAQAKTSFPNANSLMYSIYKLLPNDTDLTVFRENGKIQGYNFAFIDRHFNYHTSQDDLAHLDVTSLAHQGSYLMPLLRNLANADLSKLDSSDDEVYFSIPHGFVHYPFSWNLPLLIIAVLLFCGLIFLGLGKRVLQAPEMARGFVLLLSTVIVAGGIGFLGWRLLLMVYPEYADIQQGFTYNGHLYIAAFLLLTLAIGWLFYHKNVTAATTMNYLVAPLTVWLLINAGLVAFLPGAGFFIIPVLLMLLVFAWFIATQKPSLLLAVLCAIPGFVLFIPFLVALPVGLGLKMLFASTSLAALLFGLLLPVFGSFAAKGRWAVFMVIGATGFFIWAHLESGYSTTQAKPDSLVYYFDADKQQALWATYDTAPDNWTKTYLGQQPLTANSLNRDALFSKYNKAFTWCAPAPDKQLKSPKIEFLRDSVAGGFRYLDIRIQPQRRVNRYDIFANEKANIFHLVANGVRHLNQKGALYAREGSKILSYYVVDNEPLRLQFAIPANVNPDLRLLESSFDLLENPLFGVAKRPADKMPAPFILNDAVCIHKKIRHEAALAVAPTQISADGQD